MIPMKLKQFSRSPLDMLICWFIDAGQDKTCVHVLIRMIACVYVFVCRVQKTVGVLAKITSS